MKWLCGVLISLASLTSLTACAQTSTMDDSSAFEELADGSCTSAQSRSVEAHISGQIAALSKQDWESAYSYASLGFQELVGLDQFIFVITSQYQMLIDSQGAEFGACTIVNNEINQEVSVTSENQSFELGYSLSYDGKALGIESATTILREAETNI
jgi:hypothetical protein